MQEKYMIYKLGRGAIARGNASQINFKKNLGGKNYVRTKPMQCQNKYQKS